MNTVGSSSSGGGGSVSVLHTDDTDGSDVDRAAHSSHEPSQSNTTTPIKGSTATATLREASSERQRRLLRRGTARRVGHDDAADDVAAQESNNNITTSATPVQNEVTEDDDGEDEDLEHGSGDRAGDVSSSQEDVATEGLQRMYSCDACPCRFFASEALLRDHVVQEHAELIPEYVSLQRVARKLVPVWAQVLARKRDVVARWGRKVFYVALRRDAGPAKMAEAHRARAQLEAVVQRWQPTVRVYIFGSTVAFGVWDGISDIDFTVVDVAMQEAGAWPPPERNAVRSITELLRRAGFTYQSLEPIASARVPIIKHHASAPIRLEGPPRAETSSGEGCSEDGCSPSSRWEAEEVIARSVRYTLSGPASAQDRICLEASIRAAVGVAGVQQVWWNRTADMLSVTCATTTLAMRAAMCEPRLASPQLRVKVQPLHDECRPELYNVDFDLSFRVFGIRNSLLLRRYLTAHPCARAGAIVLKDWSKTSGVNNSVSGYLTSYAVNIMWIYYLVQKGVVPYVDPQDDIPVSLQQNTQYDPPYCPMAPPQWHTSEREQLCEQAGELLLGFFYFYALEFDWERNVVSLNKRGITTKKMLGWDIEDVAPAATVAAVEGNADVGRGVAGRRISPYAGNGGGGAGHHHSHHRTRYAFCIEDPYEENLNLGRHMGMVKALRVQTEFTRGLLSLLRDDDCHSCVFAATDAMEGRQRAAAAAAMQSDSSEQLLGLSLSQQQPPSASTSSPLLLRNSTGRQISNAAVQLPLRVLWRLMAICTQEWAKAEQERCRAGATVTTTSQPATVVDDGGEAEAACEESLDEVEGGSLGEAELRRALQQQAPMEYELACKAWNWQQLLHRLGYKVQGGRVRRRRQVGVWRDIAPRGLRVLDASDGDDNANRSSSSNTEVSPGAEPAAPPPPSALNAQRREALLKHRFPADLSTDMIFALREGYMRLTPRWVPWTVPWAALPLRHGPFFRATITPTTPSSSAVVDSGVTGMSSGPLKSTPHRLARWHVTSAIVAARGATLRQRSLVRHFLLPRR